MTWLKSIIYTQSVIVFNIMAEILDVVNERDEVIGQAERDEVHKTGLMCRMAYVCFYTVNKEIILQRRSLSKKSHPGKLTTTVSGHVASGDTYHETAIKETFEETGVVIDPAKLTDLGVVHANYIENETYLSNAMRALYAYQYDGDIYDLKVENGEGAGFELMAIDEFKQRSKSNPEEFVTLVVDQHGQEMIRKIEEL